MSKLVSNTQVFIDPEAVVCSECELIGPITIGPRSVVHTRARIVARAGPIIIGEGNLIEELSEIINERTDENGGDDSSHTMTIGNYNVFEVDSRCAAVSVGDLNTFECKSEVGAGVVVGSGCVVGAGCRLLLPETLPDKTVVFGSELNRRVLSDKPLPQTLQLDFLRRLLPSHHYLAVTNTRR